MKNEPLISIVIPNYNFSEYLHRCINSAVDQKGDDLEILIADNCSTDDSWQVIESFSDPRIRTWRHERNIGLFPNWNFLLRYARGKYFKLLPSDDWLEPNFAQEARQLLKARPEPGVVAMLLGHRVSNEQSPPLFTISSPRVPSLMGMPSQFLSKDNFDDTLKSLHFSMPTLNILNTELARQVGGYLPEDSMRADSILFARLLAANPSRLVVSCDIPVVVTRVHHTNARFNYSRYAPFIGEIIFISELQSLVKSESERRRFEKLISIAAGQALVSLPIDLLRRRKFQEFVVNFKSFFGMGLFLKGCLALPKVSFGILMSKRPSWALNKRLL